MFSVNLVFESREPKKSERWASHRNISGLHVWTLFHISFPILIKQNKVTRSRSEVDLAPELKPRGKSAERQKLHPVPRPTHAREPEHRSTLKSDALRAEDERRVQSLLTCEEKSFIVGIGGNQFAAAAVDGGGDKSVACRLHCRFTSVPNCREVWYRLNFHQVRCSKCQRKSFGRQFS